MTPADLSRTVLRSVRRAVEEDGLRVAVPERVQVERPRPGGRGDYATNVAMRLARDAGVPALQVAEALRHRLTQSRGIAGVEITGPGFLNITLDTDARHALVQEVLQQGSRYGHGDSMSGQVLRCRHRREVRAAVVADSVGRILRSQGALVRVTCDEVPDPDWVHLRVATEYLAGCVGPGPVPAARSAGDLLRRFGPDAVRWALLRPAGHDRPHTGDELLIQRESNPLFRVRYAHSRTRALTRAAAELGFAGAYEEAVGAPALLGALGEYPAVLAVAARQQAPDRLARHLEATADAFLAFQHTVLPLGDEKPSVAHRSRLALAQAAGTVLAGGLSLLGIDAPEYL
ncbi:DALR anticodon-binding domain-containing protein [Streptomyces sp. A3M-1-3]|uniref:ArgS-related anticodon-binding protein NrtL n=1 Tax=Streptomyces sp. A3M-1-3 TaxID=2962044 RepID=UPI0020B8659F|nr:DALR anticodon-binding domain-containing protein [Streptomyces sp. A3M-1-3]MCP3816944.1 DALR anticodon-binding domain-containing protein [Streptomyces sp. A3M-1-3]